MRLRASSNKNTSWQLTNYMHKAELWPVWAEDTTFTCMKMNKLHKDSLYNGKELKICCCMSQCIFGTSFVLKS